MYIIAYLASIYVALTIAVLFFIKRVQKEGSTSAGEKDTKCSTTTTNAPGCVRSLDILAWEFEYARVTASEALRDRHLMINFFMIAVGIGATGLITYFADSSGTNSLVGMGALWVVSSVGLIHFLMLIQLRRAWFESVMTMGTIKEFCISRNSTPELDCAFRWRIATIPDQEKPWTVFFYSAVLIAFLSSVTFLSGSLIAVGDYPSENFLVTLLVATVSAIILFFTYIFFYFHLLKP